MTPSQFDTQYNQIGATYELVHEQPLQRWCVPAMITAAVGDVTGRSVLDLACGTGRWSRRFARDGASRVIGVDISDEMINLATDWERARPLGIEYHVGDARLLPNYGTFDLASAMFLLNYAGTRDELVAMLRGVTANLGARGRLVALTVNPAYRFDGPPLTKYGYTWTDRGPVGDGRLFQVTAHTGEGDVRFDNYLLGIDHYDHALRAAGFAGWSWTGTVVPDPAIAAFGESYWQDVRDNPPFAILTATVRAGRE